ncbi:MAG: hypothetical protein RL233_1731, partial [Bacteroidota bacterium]
LEPSQASTRILTISKAFFVEGQPFLNDLQGLWALNELTRMRIKQTNPF